MGQVAAQAHAAIGVAPTVPMEGTTNVYDARIKNVCPDSNQDPEEMNPSSTARQVFRRISTAEGRLAGANGPHQRLANLAVKLQQVEGFAQG